MAAGQFRVHAVSTVEEAIKLLTGIAAGGRHRHHRKITGDED